MSEQWSWTMAVDFPSRLGAHMPFLEEVLAHATELGWEGRDFFGIQMTLEETLTNAIRHGNQKDSTKRVAAECRLGSERFWLSVKDEGEGFDPSSVQDCRDDENLEAYGGRGMLLIQAYMAKVAFNERGNQITVETHRGYKPPEE